MSHEADVHPAQTKILRELLFHSSAGYAQLQKPTSLSSDHFNFHITRLVEIGLVEKVLRGQYRLTIKGKEYSNRMDTDKNTLERQPKVAVILNVEKTIQGKRYFLFQQRLKNPYYGFWGLPTGKVGWGETIAETAARELMEEAGLKAQWRVAGVYHEHALNKQTGELLEDKVFFVCHGTKPTGKLLSDVECGHNEWLTREEATAKGEVFPNFDLELDLVDSDRWLHEHKLPYSIEKF